MSGIPIFGSKKFHSYEAMNACKRDSLPQIAPQGGVNMDELIQLFNKNGVRYLLMGGQAVQTGDCSSF